MGVFPQAKRVTDRAGDFGRAIPYTGHDITAMINDSGIDCTAATDTTPKKRPGEFRAAVRWMTR